MHLRVEQPADIPHIAAVTMAAFASHPHSIQNEHHIVEALRREGALTSSLVATLDDRIIGHLAVSPVTISDGAQAWFGLGPVSVAPAHQKRGVGSALIKEGLTQLKQSGARGCVVMGEPAYYIRFGFERRDDLIYEGVPAEYFMAQKFGPVWPVGAVTYHRAFSV